MQFFTFSISTFDKSRFPRALIITWKSHPSPYPHCTSTPLRLTHQDKHGQEQKNILNLIMVFQSRPETTTTTSVTKIYQTLGILNQGDLWRLPPCLQGPSQAGALSGQNPLDDTSCQGHSSPCAPRLNIGYNTWRQINSTRLSLPNFRIHRVHTGNCSLELWRRWAAGE